MILETRQNHPFAIDAWVLLPEHLQCIWTLPPGDTGYTTQWGIIKGGCSKQARKLFQRPDWINQSKAKHRRVRYGSDVFGNTRFAIRTISTGISTTIIGIRSSIGLYPARSIGRIRRFINMSRKAYSWRIGAETELIDGFPMHFWILRNVMVGMSTCPPYWAVHYH